SSGAIKITFPGGRYVGCFELLFKVDFVVFVRGSGDSALQEYNLSTGSPVDCESIQSRFELTAGPGFFFGVPLQATVKSEKLIVSFRPPGRCCLFDCEADSFGRRWG